MKPLDIRHPREIEVEDIAWLHGVLVREEALDSSEGRLVCRSDKGIITVNANIPEAGRKRFAISHELGHFELHRDPGFITLYTDRDFLWYETRDKESEANGFAAELLMPEHLFQPMCKSGFPCFETASALANQFRTSLTAATLRYVEYSPYLCAIVMSQDKIIKWYQPSEDFRYHMRVRSELSHNTVAIDFFNGKELPRSMEPVLASSWIDNSRIDRDAVIKEQAMAIPRYNVVLSLLWIDDDIS